MIQKTIRILGVPLDLGANRRGVDMGPSLLRASGLGERLRRLGHDVVDAGNVPVEIAETRQYGVENARFLEEISRTCRHVRREVFQALERGEIPLVLGGDHSMAVGSIAGVSEYHRKKKKEKIGLIWFDAHADMNTPETSPSGNVHGMPLAASLGYGPKELTKIGGFSPKVSPEKTVLVGIRSIDRKEREIVRESGITVFTMKDIDEMRITRVMDQAVEIASSGTAGFHVSFDMDFCDPSAAPAVGTPEQGGATYRESHLALEKIAESGKMLSMDVAELNPMLDYANRTGEFAIGLILSAFGRQIL